MANIFDDISADELSNYHDELNNMDPKELFNDDNIDKHINNNDKLNNIDSKELINETQFMKNYKLMEKYGFGNPKGVMLSYGDSKGLMTVGTFMVTGYVDRDNNPTSEISAFDDGFVVLEELGFDKRGRITIKENGGRLVMPYKSFLIACHNINHNSEELGHLASDDGVSLEAVKMVDDTVQDILADREPDSEITEIYLRGTSLEEAHATFTGGDGVEMGSNYTMFPFEVFQFLRLQKIYEYNYSKDKKKELEEIPLMVPYPREIIMPEPPEQPSPEIPGMIYYDDGKPRGR